jgi:glycosyltransferase involved in cell wall biosynthesis
VNVPLVSVVIPAYNRKATIGRAVLSILTQSINDLEVVVVDDGSHDGTSQAVEEIAKGDPRVRLVRYGSNRGAQAARNSGIKAARGEWIAFLDSDDTWLSSSVQLRIAAAQSGNVQVVHSAGFVLRCGGRERETFEVPALCGNVYRQLLRGEGPLFQALLVSAKALQAIGGLDEAIVAYQEWETSIRLARQFEFGFVPEPTFVYDCRGTDTISKDLLRGAKGYEQIVRKHLRDIVLHAGPRSVSEHYARLSSEYRIAGDQDSFRRCKYISYLWWPSPRMPLRRMRQLWRVKMPRLGDQ